MSDLECTCFFRNNNLYFFLYWVPIQWALNYMTGSVTDLDIGFQLFLWRNSSTRALACSIFRFLGHTQLHTHTHRVGLFLAEAFSIANYKNNIIAVWSVHNRSFFVAFVDIKIPSIFFHFSHS